jgi:protein involved in polysaccharide export with SLBB domain
MTGSRSLWKQVSERVRTLIRGVGERRRTCGAPIFAVLALALIASACATGGASQSEPAALQASAYRLGAGDQVTVTVFGRTELSGAFPVSSSGYVDYPLIGQVEVAGKTTDEVSATIAERLRAGYVRDPAVNVAITTYRPFFILGEVTNAGSFPYTPNLTVRGAIATAGGYTYRANTRRVYIQHPGQTRETAYVLTGTLPIRPGDVVRVPERFF